MAGTPHHKASFICAKGFSYLREERKSDFLSAPRVKYKVGVGGRVLGNIRSAILARAPTNRTWASLLSSSVSLLAPIHQQRLLAVPLRHIADLLLSVSLPSLDQATLISCCASPTHL